MVQLLSARDKLLRPYVGPIPSQKALAYGLIRFPSVLIEVTSRQQQTQRTTNEGKNQFFFTRAAPSTSGRAKEQILIS
jgi:hypothetical protein